jgi:hypothetical protein
LTDQSRFFGVTNNFYDPVLLQRSSTQGNSKAGEALILAWGTQMKSANGTTDAASFIADMTRELATMARKLQQTNLAYLLDVAALEAQRTAEAPCPEVGSAAPEAISRH